MSVLRECAYCREPFEVPYQSDPRRHCSASCGAHVSKNKRHGYAGTKTHATWLDMRNRCRNPDFSNYARYGGRGITICDRWDVFENFLADMGEHPGKGYSIERKNNDGNYEPDNCKWGTKLEQSRNRCISYTPDNDATIRAMLAKGHSYRDVGKVIGRSVGGVQARASRLGVHSLALPPRKCGGLYYRGMPTALSPQEREVGK